jgi:hypothetical protein
MKWLVFISVLFLGFQVPKKHKHVADKHVKMFYDPLLYRDTTKIKNNVVTYVMKVYTCKICLQEFKVRQNIDTFSTKRKAKYSNLKYLKH